MATELQTSPSAAYAQKLKAIRRELKDEYLQPHTKPWTIGFSGGKDSTLWAQLGVECLLSISPDQRWHTNENTDGMA
jgi:DNA sulfur modification protein DndC